jgi:hypothetical protein
LLADLSPRFPGLRIEDMKDRLTDEDFRGEKIPACYLFQAAPAP